MKKVTTIEPKEIFSFFKELDAEHSAFLLAGKTGVTVQETADAEDPPSVAYEAKVKREDWLVFIRVLVALRGNRPVKIVPHAKTEFRVLVGPKP